MKGDIKNVGRAMGLTESNPTPDDLPAAATCPKCGKRQQVVSQTAGLVEGVLRCSPTLVGLKCGHEFNVNEVVS